MSRPAPTAMITFFALAFAWSWSFWLVAPLFRSELPLAATALGLIGGFGPSLAALFVVARHAGRSGLQRWVRHCLQWRAIGRWMVLAFFFPLACMGLAGSAHVVLGGTLPPSPAAGHALLAAANFVLVFLVGGPLGEEFGWRGFALPALQRRWGWRVASLLLGGVWALWHLPLVYSAGSTQSHLPMGLYALSTVASSVVFAWLYNRTLGSLLPILVLHTAVNAWAAVMPVMARPDSSQLRPFQLMVGILVIVAVGLLLGGNRGAGGEQAARSR